MILKKLLMLSSHAEQSIPKVFCAINCCSYNTFLHSISLEGLRYPSRGLIISLEGFRYPSRGFIVPLEGLRYPSRGFIVPLEGLRYPSRGVKNSTGGIQISFQGG